MDKLLLVFEFCLDSTYPCPHRSSMQNQFYLPLFSNLIISLIFCMRVCSRLKVERFKVWKLSVSQLFTMKCFALFIYTSPNREGGHIQTVCYRYLLPNYAPMQVDPTWQSLLQLHMCFAGKPVRPHHETSLCGPLRREEGTLPAPYCKRPRMAGWGSP